MKVLRTKRFKKTLNFYRINFGFREPYKVLLDKEFVSCLVRYSSSDIKKELGRILGFRLFLLVSKCLLREFMNERVENLEVAKIMNQLVPIQCTHSESSVSGHECMLSAAQADKYILATMDMYTLVQSSKFPQIPVVFFEANLLMIRKPAVCSLEAVEAKLDQALSMTKSEQDMASNAERKLRAERAKKNENLTRFYRRFFRQHPRGGKKDLNRLFMPKKKGVQSETKPLSSARSPPSKTMPEAAGQSVDAQRDNANIPQSGSKKKRQRKRKRKAP